MIRQNSISMGSPNLGWRPTAAAELLLLRYLRRLIREVYWGGVDKGELPLDLELFLCLVSADFAWVDGDTGGGRRVVSFLHFEL